ncbi:hypothetical protein PSTT_11454 [Puccinia striiformis]|uniref:ATP-dependent RNA helicase n=1 Tax=Puccinia striiformis TaxID=27350 RepID=A0A2S4V096_9BASI|nr:hypothetical protein PSTT_11454 [Puccinia striiformis]
MNILVYTPVRLQQHLKQSTNFDSDNLHVLVLDKADQILDVGFAHSSSAIILGLTNSRQSLLYLATRTKFVKDLARSSLTGDPDYVLARETGVEQHRTTPKELSQAGPVHSQNLLTSEARDTVTGTKFTSDFSHLLNHLCQAPKVTSTVSSILPALFCAPAASPRVRRKDEEDDKYTKGEGLDSNATDSGDEESDDAENLSVATTPAPIAHQRGVDKPTV